MGDDRIKCSTYDRTPCDPDDPTQRLSREFEVALRESISRGRAAPSVRVLYGEVVALRRELQRHKPEKCGNAICGCGGSFDVERVYRCVDCDTPFHRHCLESHCKSDLNEARAETASLRSRLAKAEAVLQAARQHDVSGCQQLREAIRDYDAASTDGKKKD